MRKLAFFLSLLVAISLFAALAVPPLVQAQISPVQMGNGRTFGDNEIDGKDVNTGGTVLFISPGIQYIVTGNLLFETGVQIPIVNDFPSGALEPNYTVLFGFRYFF